MEEIRHEYSWLTADSSIALLGANRQTEWWTFAGSRANATLERQFALATTGKIDSDSFKLTFDPTITLQDVERALGEIRRLDVAEMRPAVDEAAIEGLKFSECLPVELAIEMLERRLQDVDATMRTLNQHPRFCVQQ